MAFRALLFSKSPETCAAITAACESSGIRAEACSDIFAAIEKVKTRTFSCVIPDWSDQPEAGFLLKRARESTLNQRTIAIAIVDHEPTSGEMHDNRLDYLIYRPISVEEADAVLVKASEQMQALSAQDGEDQAAPTAASVSTASPAHDQKHDDSPEPPADLSEETVVDATADDDPPEEFIEPGGHSRAVGPRQVIAAALLLIAVFLVWRSRATITYLANTPEGAAGALRESVAALFYMTPSGALPVGSVGSDAQQDAYFSRNSAISNTQAPQLGVAATVSSLPDIRLPLRKAYDLPLPIPIYEPPQPVPVRVVRAAIPDSMRNSPPIAPPVVVTVNPAQMMPVSAPQSQPIVPPTREPVPLTEQAARALLIHSVDPVYPQEGLAQKLHGPVVLQALIARDGSVEDLKIVRGYFILGRAAIAAVKQWRFQPYSLNGRAASTQTQITVNFTYPPG